MAPRVEDGVEVFLLDAIEANGFIQLSFRRRVLLKPDREIGTGFGFVALGIERRTAAFRRCERDLDAGILKNVVGDCELFEPKSCLSPRLPSWSWDVMTISTFMTFSLLRCSPG